MSERIKIDTNKVIERVYHTKELHKIIEDVIISYVNDVVLMSDTQLKVDRSDWIKKYGRDDYGVFPDGEEHSHVEYDTSIHTIAIEIEQLRRYKEIVYEPTKQLKE